MGNFLVKIFDNGIIKSEENCINIINSNNLYLFYCSLLRKYGKIDVNI